MVYNLILNIQDRFWFDTSTSILYFDKDVYKQEQYDSQKIQHMFMKSKINQINKPRQIQTINLLPSMRCNGRCSYCYNEDVNNIQMEDLTFTQLKNTLETCEYSLQLNTIRMYGGEPLLNDELYMMIDYLLNINSNMTIYISSGLFFSDAIFNKRVQQLKNIPNIKLGIGVDLGTYPETRCGLYINKQMLLERCHTLIENGFSLVFANTVSKNTNTLSLFSEIKEIQKMYNGYTNKIAYRISIACDAKLTPYMSQLDELYNYMKSIYIESPQINITSNLYPYTDVIYAPSIYKLSNTSYYFHYPPFYCGLFRDMITILPNGKICHCHMNILDDTMNINNFKYKEDFLQSKQCAECDYILICRGGCLYRKQIANTVLENNQNIYCEWIKKSFELSLYKLLNTYIDIKKTLDKLSIT